MIDFKQFPNLIDTAESVTTEVLILSDVVGEAEATLAEVMHDFLSTFFNPILSGAFALAHHGFVRGDVDIDLIAVAPLELEIEALKSKGYRYESTQLPIGAIELLTKANKGIDVLHLNDGEFLKSIVARAVPGKILNDPVRMVSIEDLMILKHLAVKGRRGAKDPIDLEQLEQMPFDRAYVDQWKIHFKI